jgi:NAD(P)H dehydrogenase (quinone)
MKVLVIFVHPRRESFCGGLLEAVTTGLTEAGHEIEVADLHAEAFNPVFTAADYAQFSGGPMPNDVLREQARIEWSEGIVIVTPIWWYQFPAMLKGWVDRVFSKGWAFDDSHAFKQIGWRKLLVLASAGAKAETFEKYGYTKGIESLWDVGIWGYCGFENRHTEFFWGVQPRQMSDAERGTHMNTARDLGKNF